MPEPRPSPEISAVDERALGASGAPVVFDVLVVVGARMYRDWLRESLGDQSDLRVVRLLANFDHLASETQRLAPAVIVAELGCEYALSAITSLRNRGLDLPIVGLVPARSGRDLAACVAAGITGYVTNEQSIDELISTIRAVAAGEFVCPPQMAAQLIERLTTRDASTAPPGRAARLTAREHEIAYLIEQGASNREISAALCIELATVKNHVHNILFKLQLSRRGEVAAWVRGAPQRGAAPGLDGDR